jgi:hypothetical protein
VNIEVFAEQLFDFVVFEHADAHLEKSSFLLQEPFAQLFVSAVG